MIAVHNSKQKKDNVITFQRTKKEQILVCRNQQQTTSNLIFWPFKYYDIVFILFIVNNSKQVLTLNWI